MIVGNNQSGIISTHTLTWSVTYVKRGRLHGGLDFNSHAHVERDLLWLKKSI